METKRLATALTVKAVDTSQRRLSGYAAVFGNLDRTGDIIEKSAFDRTLRESPDVAVFIGHRADTMPVGEVMELRSDDFGLYSDVKVYNTPAGDELLEVASQRLGRGKSLGMSIGYRTRSEKWVKGIRHLLDLDLAEFSYLASPDLAANPLATVVGVKATGIGSVITTSDSYEDLIDDLEDAAQEKLGGAYCCVCATFSDHVIVSTMGMGMGDGEVQYFDIPYTLNSDNEPELGDPQPVDPAYVPSDAKARVRTRGQQEGRPMLLPTPIKAAWNAAFVNDLDDEDFAYIEPGGVKDDSGRTTPRSLRHFPHHTDAADGSHPVDLAHLRNALSRAPDSEFGAKALPHLERHAKAEGIGKADGKSIDTHAPEWSEGAPAALLIVGYKVDQLITDIAADRVAMERLGIDTKKGARLNSSMRSRLKDLHSSLGQILEWAETVEKGDDGKMRVDLFRHRLAMLDLEEVS